MRAVEIILFIVGILGIIIAVYMIGRIQGDVAGYRRAFDEFTSVIEADHVEDNYIEDYKYIPKRSFEQKDIKPKRRYYKKHAPRGKSLFEMASYDIMNWYYKDFVGKIKPPKRVKFTKKEINRVCNEIAEEMGITL